MIVSEVRPKLPERLHYLVIIQIPNLTHGSVDTGIDPIFQVKIFCCLDHHGIEIGAPSTSGDGSNSWIIISRGPHRFVEELWHDPDNSLESREIVCHTSDGRRNAIISIIEKTHASQSQAQSDLTYYHSEFFIQFYRRKRNDIPACGTVEKEVSGVKNLEICHKFGTTS